MYPKVLSDQQRELLPFIAQFKHSFYLVGGTAIALHIGHRRSIDFDLFTVKKINKSQIKKKIFELPYSKKILFEDVDQLHFYINNVKITFFHYPYPVEHSEKLDAVVSLPSLLSLSAMKAFALGRRAKWKDYVDLYFLLKNHFSVREISIEAERIFGQLFSEKLFREQLAFHKDIDFSEAIEFLPGFEITNQEVKNILIDKSLQELTIHEIN
jgi:hypothetical protein